MIASRPLAVQPFVDLLTSGGFQADADINQDGDVTLLNVDPFVALLVGRWVREEAESRSK